VKTVLKPVLENPSIVKVFHDARQAADALYHQFGIRLANIFDTQVRVCECNDKFIYDVTAVAPVVV
jgi:ribonuclease D